MLRFKEFLLQEILTPEEEVSVNATYPEQEHKVKEHLDKYFGKGIEDKYEPLDLPEEQEKSETHKAIENHLGKEISKEDYKQGVTLDKYNRKTKLGRILDATNAPEELKTNFQNDPSRQAKNEEGLQIRTTRSKTGIAGQTSHNQSWPESCKNFTNGVNRKYLPREYEHGSVVTYLHDKNGKEIARKTFHPYYNDSGEVVYRENSHYGVNHAEFNDHARKLEKHLSTKVSNPSSIYHISPSVYNNGSDEVVNPNLSDEDHKKLLEKYNTNNREHIVIRKAIASDTRNPKLIDKILNNPDESHFVLEKALTNKNISKNTLKDRLSSKTKLSYFAMGNSKAKHILQNIPDFNENPNLTKNAYTYLNYEDNPHEHYLWHLKDHKGNYLLDSNHKNDLAKHILRREIANIDDIDDIDNHPLWKHVIDQNDKSDLIRDMFSKCPSEISSDHHLWNHLNYHDKADLAYIKMLDKFGYSGSVNDPSRYDIGLWNDLYPEHQEKLAQDYFIHNSHIDPYHHHLFKHLDYLEDSVYNCMFNHLNYNISDMDIRKHPYYDELPDDDKESFEKYYELNGKV